MSHLNYRIFIFSKQCISKLVAVLLVVFASLVSDSHGFENELCKMIDKTDLPCKAYMTGAWRDIDPLRVVDECIICSPSIRSVLIEIANDEVGGLALKLFYQA